MSNHKKLNNKLVKERNIDDVGEAGEEQDQHLPACLVTPGTEEQGKDDHGDCLQDLSNNFYLSSCRLHLQLLIWKGPIEMIVTHLRPSYQNNLMPSSFPHLYAVGFASKQEAPNLACFLNVESCHLDTKNRKTKTEECNAWLNTNISQKHKFFLPLNSGVLWLRLHAKSCTEYLT